jgi:hypothetical protein
MIASSNLVWDGNSEAWAREKAARIGPATVNDTKAALRSVEGGRRPWKKSMGALILSIHARDGLCAILNADSPNKHLKSMQKQTSVENPGPFNQDAPQRLGIPFSLRAAARALYLATRCAGLWGLAALVPGAATGQTNYAPPSSFTNRTERIGVYDSRAIAYADFVSEGHMVKIKSMVAAANEAKNAGETAKLKELSAALKAEQERSDLQVFSSAPVDDALAAIKARVEEVKKAAGVELLVSKWDTKALAERKGAQPVDVTAELLRDYKLTEKQLKVVSELQKHPPMPIDKAQKLAAQGKL